MDQADASAHLNITLTPSHRLASRALIRLPDPLRSACRPLDSRTVFRQCRAQLLDTCYANALRVFQWGCHQSSRKIKACCVSGSQNGHSSDCLAQSGTGPSSISDDLVRTVNIPLCTRVCWCLRQRAWMDASRCHTLCAGQAGWC